MCAEQAEITGKTNPLGILQGRISWRIPLAENARKHPPARNPIGLDFLAFSASGVRQETPHARIYQHGRIPVGITTP